MKSGGGTASGSDMGIRGGLVECPRRFGLSQCKGFAQKPRPARKLGRLPGNSDGEREGDCPFELGSDN
jgi:hypothetical protein